MKHSKQSLISMVFPGVPSAEVTIGLLSKLIADPRFYSIVTEINHQVVGSNFWRGLAADITLSRSLIVYASEIIRSSPAHNTQGFVTAGSGTISVPSRDPVKVPVLVAVTLNVNPA